MARSIKNYNDDKKGKVRQLKFSCNYLLNNQVLIETSDRLSANDQSLGEINGKGKILSQLGGWWFDELSSKCPEIPHHYLYSSNVNSWVCKKAEPIALEFIVRGHLFGSMWRRYQKGERDFYGITLPDNMSKGAILPNGPLVTPTTKESEPGKHDRPITKEEIIKNGILSLDDYNYCEELALKVFKFGREVCQQHRLILVDTKYEFGYDKESGKIMLIDEIHTPDSSRFWGFPTNQLLITEDGPVVQTFDKEVARNYLNSNPDAKELPENVQNQLMYGYKTVYEKLTGKKFTHNNNNKYNIRIMAGSISDKWHCNKLINEIENNLMNDCNWHVYYMSAHKNTSKVLTYLNSLEGKNILITVAGRSNALSGVTTCNCEYPVFACPPFKDKVDMMVNINSTLQMPSNTPVMTVLSVDNVIKCCERIILLNK